MLHAYCSEMKESVPTEATITKTVGNLSLIEQKPIEMRATMSYYGAAHWIVTTTRELNGRGITNNGKNLRGENTYRVTARAFEKLCEQYEIRSDYLLD